MGRGADRRMLVSRSASAPSAIGGASSGGGSASLLAGRGVHPRWLHPVSEGGAVISRSAAEKLLADGSLAAGKNGMSVEQPTWLVRAKGKADSYVISVRRPTAAAAAAGSDTYGDGCWAVEHKHYLVERSVRADGTCGSHFVVNSSVRLHMCVAIEDVVKVLRECPVTSQRVGGRPSPLLNGLPTLRKPHGAISG